MIPFRKPISVLVSLASLSLGHPAFADSSSEAIAPTADREETDRFAVREDTPTLAQQLRGVEPGNTISGAESEEQLAEKYRSITKKILLASIELERYSLKYRRDSARQPKLKRLRYFLAQETGAACGMAYEIAAISQLKEGRKRPLRIKPKVLKHGFQTAKVGSIIAGSGSALELTSNTMLALKNFKNGIDSRSANKFVVNKLKEIDGFLKERNQLVEQHKDHPFYKSAVLEGEVLSQLHKASIYEYAQFHKDVRSYRAQENSFYLLNIASTTLEAISVSYGVKALRKPKYNGPTNVLFTIAGAITTVAPLLSYATGKGVEKYLDYRLGRILPEKPQTFDYSRLKTLNEELSHSLGGADSEKVHGAIFRAGKYRESGELFRKQIRSEERIIHHLQNVAVQSAIIGPPIGGTLLAQGIAGTVGFYKYERRPRKMLDLFYKGSVSGLVGSSTAVGVTAAALIADWSYEHKLSKQKKLPRQLIEARLQHIDEIEQAVIAM